MENYKTEQEVRDAFWAAFPRLRPTWRARRSHNDYSTDVRSTFVEFVDDLQKSGQISDKLADRATLGG